MALRYFSRTELAEDGASITRRLLEIGIQAVYIGADSENAECERRAGRYLAYLWRETAATAKAYLGEAGARWDAIAAKFGGEIPSNAKRWGPSFAEDV